ncbi:nucleoside/nucleotide kinase family protein [Amycolatopsis aidingensis]|uniref:uridine kinase n=1 Tax=Amycolatopsis aidingensis TaxID=2842453 RepID=UPI001C0CDAA4|nr:uridine kinase [Amycolatopsis aidingensis]
MRYRPITFDRLADELTERVLARDGGGWTRIVFDGAEGATDPATLADGLVDRLRVHGRPALRVSAHDFLRPASVRLERGRRDPDARYEDWLDTGALRREVLDPLGPGGNGMVLPALWDPVADRALRLPRTHLPPGGVLLLDGELLLGRGLPVELAVHLWLSPTALRRRIPERSAWALPAYTRYEQEVAPAEIADVVLRVDRPSHPAILMSGDGVG